MIAVHRATDQQKGTRPDTKRLHRKASRRLFLRTCPPFLNYCVWGDLHCGRDPTARRHNGQVCSVRGIRVTTTSLAPLCFADLSHWCCYSVYSVHILVAVIVCLVSGLASRNRTCQSKRCSPGSLNPRALLSHHPIVATGPALTGGP